MRYAKSLIVGGVFVFACSSEDSLGHKSAPVNPGLTSENAPVCSHVSYPKVVAGGGVVGIPDPELVGTWLGYSVNHPFDSGSNQVELVVSGTNPAGRIIFGKGTPPSPATDPNLGYPPAASPEDMGSGYRIYEGVSYTFLGGNIDGAHIQLKASTTELYRDWCAMQISYQQNTQCGCIPNWYAHMDVQYLESHCSIFLPGTGASAPIDCVKLQLCSHSPCYCDETGCQASLETTLSLDLTRNGDQLTGNINGATGFDVVLTKQ